MGSHPQTLESGRKVGAAVLAVVGTALMASLARGSDLRADAGEDQAGVVGLLLTLDGGRSEPKEQVGFRWFQLAGPTVKLKIEDGPRFTFVPTDPGLYRFGLVVASGSVISDPDTVDVVVRAAVDPPHPLDELARACLNSIPGGPNSASGLADAFDAIAGRMDLYPTFADVQSEMSRRLEPIVPRDPGTRAVWVDRLFAPLSDRLIADLLAEGLDLRRPEGQNAPLSDQQRAALVAHNRAIAKGFRTATSPH